MADNMDLVEQPRKVEVKKILIADALPLMRAIIKRFLFQLNVPYQCIEAGDGVEALYCLADTKVALIFLDLKIPKLSGVDFLKAVRGLKLDVPIIVVTGESNPLAIKEAIQAGATDLIAKPVTMEILREKLVKLNYIKEVKPPSTKRQAS
jgi:two-component system chemotaxis response regulator CheY